MRRASLFLAPTDVESFGLAVVEAMAAALPVVAADAGGHRETIGSATPETLYPPTDPDAAAAVLAALAADPAAHVPARTRRAGERFLAAFTIERHVDQLDALYRRLADR